MHIVLITCLYKALRSLNMQTNIDFIVKSQPDGLQSRHRDIIKMADRRHNFFLFGAIDPAFKLRPKYKKYSIKTLIWCLATTNIRNAKLLSNSSKLNSF